MIRRPPKNPDDPILRDGETYRVSMLEMSDSLDAVQTDVAGQYGALGKNFPEQVPEVPPTFTGELAPGQSGAYPNGVGTTTELPPKKGPARSAAAAAAEEAYATRSLELSKAWKTK